MKIEIGLRYNLSHRIRPVLLFVFLFFCGQTQGQDNDRLVELYRNKKWDQLDQVCRQILTEKPLDPAVSLIYGRAFADRNQTDSALGYLKNVLALAHEPWMKAWAYGYVGVCLYRSDQRMLARLYLDSALLLNATANATKYALGAKLQLGLDETMQGWETVATKNIRFHFQDSVLLADKDAFIRRRLEAFDELQKFFQATLPKPIDFYVWKSRESAQETIYSNIGFSRAEDAVIHSLYNQTPGHELTHVLLQHGFKPEYKTRLMNEGIAVRFDLTPRNYLEEARTAVRKRGKELRIELFWENDKVAGEELFYPVGGAWVDFLKAKVTDQEFRSILQDQRLSNAQVVLKDRLSDLMTAFDDLVNAR